MTERPAPLLEHCPLVIFIAYTVPPEAEENGYSDWLRRVDCPFFNDIPGTLHYANWRLTGAPEGTPLAWDYYDFQGLEREEDLQRVWFNPDLDHFRSEWLRLWGYGRGEPPPVLRHSYVMRPVVAPKPGRAKPFLGIAAGQGPVPADLEADAVFRVEGVLRKHFAGSGERPADWHRPAAEGNPLGLDWMSLHYADSEAEIRAPRHPTATLRLASRLIAAPEA